MKIYRDTNEIKPLTFPKDEMVTEVLDKNLYIGDYQAEFVDGSLSRTVFDRKSLGDLYGTMTGGMERFKRLIKASKERELDLVIIVECSFSEVMKGYPYSNRKPESLIKTLGTLWYKYGVQTVFCKDRSDMAEYIIWRFKSEGFHKIRSLNTGFK